MAQLTAETLGGRRSAILHRLSLAVAVIFLLAPIIAVTVGSLTETQYVVFPPKGLTLKWYWRMFDRPEMLSSFLLSLGMAAAAATIATVVAMLASLEQCVVFCACYSFSVLLGAARRARIPQRGPGSARRVAPRRRDRHRHRRRAGAQQGARRRHQRTAARHPPARRHRDPLRVVWRADRQGRAPSRAALRPRRARAGHDIDRQRRVGSRRSVVLHPQGGLGRLPHRLPADDEEGGERPARVARRGHRGQARDAQARRGRVPARREHLRRRLSGAMERRSRTRRG